MKLIKLVIDRSKWLRGQDGNLSRLLDGQGNMCCLGFLGRACGYTRQELGWAISPGELPSKDDRFNANNDDSILIGSGRWPKKIARVNAMQESLLTHMLMGINDATCRSGFIAIDSRHKMRVADEAARERHIARLMRKAGIAVTFVDKLPRRRLSQRTP